jgi:hypothetical protein
MDFFLCFYQHLTLFALATLNGVVDDTSSFCFGTADLLLSNLLAVGNTKEETNNSDCCKTYNE